MAIPKWNYTRKFSSVKKQGIRGLLGNPMPSLRTPVTGNRYIVFHSTAEYAPRRDLEQAKRVIEGTHVVLAALR